MGNKHEVAKFGRDFDDGFVSGLGRFGDTEKKIGGMLNSVTGSEDVGLGTILSLAGAASTGLAGIANRKNYENQSDKQVGNNLLEVTKRSLNPEDSSQYGSYV
jgi:hypothetical protein